MLGWRTIPLIQSSMFEVMMCYLAYDTIGPGIALGESGGDHFRSRIDPLRFYRLLNEFKRTCSDQDNIDGIDLNFLRRITDLANVEPI